MVIWSMRSHTFCATPSLKTEARATTDTHARFCGWTLCPKIAISVKFLYVPYKFHIVHDFSDVPYPGSMSRLSGMCYLVESCLFVMCLLSGSLWMQMRCETDAARSQTGPLPCSMSPLSGYVPIRWYTFRATLSQICCIVIRSYTFWLRSG